MVVVTAVLLVVTIIGIPFAWAHRKLGGSRQAAESEQQTHLTDDDAVSQSGRNDVASTRRLSSNGIEPIDLRWWPRKDRSNSAPLILRPSCIHKAILRPKEAEDG